MADFLRFVDATGAMRGCRAPCSVEGDATGIVKTLRGVRRRAA